jgi:hypothetical protein
MAFALGTLEFLLVMAMAALFIDATGIAGRQENGLSCSAFASIYNRSFYRDRLGTNMEKVALKRRAVVFRQISA